LNIYAATSNTGNAPSFYYSVYQVDADGLSNPILIASGSNEPVLITNLQSSQTLYDVALYVPSYTLTNSTKRIQLQLFVNSGVTARTAYFEFRSGAISHLHTTLAITAGSTGATGPTLPVQGSGTGSILLQNAGNSNVYFSNSLQIANTGATQYISVSGDILPTQTNVFNIGSPTNRFNSLWLTGSTLYLGAGSISADASGTIYTTNAAGVTGSVGSTGPTGPTPQGTTFGDYLYWNGTAWVVGSTSVLLGANAGQTNQATGSVAIGYQAGNSNQSTGSVAIGYQAGFTGQNPYSVALGYQAGFTGHGTGSIAIGYQAGYADAIGPNSIAIGTQAGQYGLGSNTVAIGYLAGPTGSAFSNNIILNAAGTGLNPSTGSALYVNPIRNTLGSATSIADTSAVLFYNATTNEVTYGSKSLTNNIQTEQFMVAGGSGTNVLGYSYEGTNWYPCASGNSLFSTVNGVAWNGSLWVAVGAGAATGLHTLAHSSDGINWTGDGSGVFTTQGYGVAWNGSLWVAGGSGTNTIAYSSDGINWTGLGLVFPTTGFGVAWNGSLWVAAGNNAGTGQIAYSSDGINWTVKTVLTGTTRAIAWNGSLWVVVGTSSPSTNPKITYSYDGINWTTTAISFTSSTIFGVASNGPLWVATGSSTSQNHYMHSYDGINWVGDGSGVFLNGGNAVAWNGSLWVAGGSSSATTSSLAYSYNGINWTGLGRSVFTTANAIASRRVLPYVGNQQIPLQVKSNTAISIGGGAGNSQQGTGSIAIGYQAGFTGQKFYSVALGYQAGFTGHGTGSIAIGYQAGYADATGPNSIAIGTQAGQFGLGSNSIAIGNLAGPTGAAFSNNIILNAAGSALNPSTGSAFYAAPIRQYSDTSSTVLFYNTTSSEVTYQSGEWTAYTPTWAADTGSVSIGNGQIVGSYKQIGKTVFFTARIQLGSSSSVSGSSGWRVGLPVTSVASPSVIANATYLDNGVAYYNGVANNEYNGSTTYVSPLCLVTGVTGTLTQVGSTQPFTWGNQDSLLITGTYQAI